MKYLYIIVLALFTLTAATEAVVAQELSKKERKRLKKEQKQQLKQLKKMSAADFQKDREAQKELKEKAGSLQSDISRLQTQLDNKDSEVKQLQDQTRRLEEQLQQAKAALAENNQVEQNVPIANAYDKGLVFRVQIGAFRDKRLEQYLNTSEDFKGEDDAQGFQKYTLGNFRDYWESDKFKKYLRAMGVRDAWIVPYSDGIRVPLKDVLENLQKQAQSQPVAVPMESQPQISDKSQSEW